MLSNSEYCLSHSVEYVMHITITFYNNNIEQYQVFKFVNKHLKKSTIIE